MTERGRTLVLLGQLFWIGCAVQQGYGPVAAVAPEHDGDALDERAEAILSESLSSSPERTLDILSRTGPAAEPVLSHALATSSDPIVRTGAGAILFESGRLDLGHELVNALESPDGRVRARAAGAILSHDASRGLVEKLALDPHPDVRTAVVRSINGSSEPWARDVILETASTDPDPDVRLASLGGLDPHDADHLRVLVEALDAEDVRMRASAAWSLGIHVDYSTSVDWADRLLDRGTTPEGLQFAAALLSRDAGHEPAIAAVDRALASPDPTVRVLALTALTRAGTHTPAAVAMSADGAPSVRLAWCRLARRTDIADRETRLDVLAGIPLDSVGPGLLVAIAEEDAYPLVRSRVWWSMQTGDTSTATYLLAFADTVFSDRALFIAGMNSDDPAVRVAAASGWLTGR